MQPEQTDNPDGEMCKSCSLHGCCGEGEPRGPLTGGRLVWRAIACFVMPVVAAIVAAALASSPEGRFAAATAAFLVTAGAMAGLNRALRRGDADGRRT